jgi:hypothetical protein
LARFRLSVVGFALSAVLAGLMPDVPRLVLVDGSASVYRAFHALPPLSNSAGIPTHAVLGFTTMLLKLVREEKPQALAIAFDGPGPTTRHREFPAYKANRPAMPDALAAQIPLIHRVVDAMRVPRLMVPGEEADDILGTVAVRAAAQAYDVRIVTSDKDLLQLVGERIVVRDPLTPKTNGPVEVQGRYGIVPRQVPDLLALMGDSSDNIPGVPGVGEKTARDLLLLRQPRRRWPGRGGQPSRRRAAHAIKRGCQALGDDPRISTSRVRLADGAHAYGGCCVFRVNSPNSIGSSSSLALASYQCKTDNRQWKTGQVFFWPVVGCRFYIYFAWHMLLVGLTGGIGVGKSTVAAMFVARGAAVVDGDEISRRLQEPGRPATRHRGRLRRGS